MTLHSISFAYSQNSTHVSIETLFAQLPALKEEVLQRETKFQESLQASTHTSDFYALLQSGALDFQKIEIWKTQTEALHETYDQLLTQRMLYLMGYSFSQAHVLHAQYQGKIPPHLEEEFTEKWKEVETQFAQWYAHHDCIGKKAGERNPTNPQDVVSKRVYGQYYYPRALFTFVQLVQKQPSYRQKQLARTSQHILGPLGATGRYLSAVTLCTLLTPPLLCAKGIQGISNALFQKNPARTPLSSWSMSTLRATQRLQGTPLIQGQEHLNRTTRQDPNSAFLYLPNHVAEFPDLQYIAALNLPQPTLFGNAGVIGQTLFDKGILGRFISRFVAGQDGIIPVGKIKGLIQDKSTPDHLIRELRHPGGMRIVNFPQGFVCEGGEVLPPSLQIPEKLFGTILSENRALTLIPLTFRQPNTFFAKPHASTLHTGPHIIVHPPISSEIVSQFHAANQLPLLCLALRQIWLFDIQDPLGVIEIEARINSWFSPSSPHLESDPDEGKEKEFLPLETF